jgi:hypothetical protein
MLREVAASTSHMDSATPLCCTQNDDSWTIYSVHPWLAEHLIACKADDLQPGQSLPPKYS